MIPGSSRRSARLYSDHPPDALFDLVTTYEHFADFIPRVSTSLVLKREPEAAEVYQRLSFPAPMSDRHYLIRSEWSADRPSEHFRVNWWMVDAPLPASQGIAIKPRQFEGCWAIRGTPGGGTDAVYSITVVPGGLIPDWLARKGIERYLEELMNALQARLAMSKPAQPINAR